MDSNKRMEENIAGSVNACQELLLWHNWRKTALIFCIMLTLLLDIAANPIISVVSVAGAIILSICICYACYVWGMRKLQKSSAVDHPFQRYLNMNVTISKETAEQLAHFVVLKLNPMLLRLRSLILVEDLLDSLKLLLLLCGLNIASDYLNGMNIVIVAFVLLFTLPKLYEWKKATINQQLRQLLLLKVQLLSPKNKAHAVPTVAVGPQFLATDLKQAANCMDNELDSTIKQFAAYEPASGEELTADYDWQEKDMPIEGYPHYKQH